jgi:large subunit ribosomal protein L28
MSKVCSITGAKVSRGSIIHRRGMAKKKGGVGRHVTKNVPRTFTPNLHEHRVWVPELKKYVRVKVTARAMKTINKNGAFATLKKAGFGLRLGRPPGFLSRPMTGLESRSPFTQVVRSHRSDRGAL